MLGELDPVGGGDPIPLLKSKMMVGRRDGCDITLKFPNISSNHCELEMLNGYWHVRDLNSSNGIKVNGVRVEGKFLMPGDELSIARHRFKVKYTPAPDAPPPPKDGDLPPAAKTENAEGVEEEPASFSSMPSLLEKAGLVRREPPAPPRKPKPPAVKEESDGSSDSDDSDDRALKHLLT